MTRSRKYHDPPVVEALCEIYFARSRWDETVPGRFYEAIKDQFPQRRRQEVHEAQIQFSASGETAAGVRRLTPRMHFVSNRSDRLIQLGEGLLVVNQLQPYPHFEEWEPSIYEAIDLYRGIAHPEGIERLGVRYINRVVIPAPRVQMEDYFTVFPNLPETMGDTHGPFMVRFEVVKEGGHTVMVTFGSAPSERSEEIIHVLDLYDIYQPIGAVRFEDVSKEVRAAHDNIEAAFEGSITDRLRSLFGPQEGS